VIAFDPNYRTRPEEFRYEWSSGRRSRTLFTGQRETTTSRAAIRAFPFDADGDYFIEVTAIDRYGYRSQPARHEFRVVLPAPSSSGLVRGVITAVVGSGILYFLLLFPIIALYARIDLARTAVGSGWFTKFPLLHKTILNSRWSRRHIFRTYAQAIAGDASKHLPPHYVSQSIDLPDDSGELTIDVTQASTSCRSCCNVSSDPKSA
jgi:hypothetical protein